MNITSIWPTRRIGIFTSIFFFVMSNAVVHAQNFPARTVRIIVSQAPGSSADTIARLIATRLSQKWSRSVVVENRPGANGNVGMNAVVRAAPDGYTLGLATPSVMTINPLIYKSMPFRPLEDLVAVVQTTKLVLGLFANPRLPIKTTSELIAYAKTRSEGLNVSSAGVGNLGHLAAELFASQAGVHITHIPNKGDTPGLLDVASGQTDVMFAPLPSGMSLLEGGRLNLIAVASASRSPTFPSVPTLAESGLRNVVTDGWTGVVAPAGTPPAIVVQIQRAVSAVLAEDEVKKSIKHQGFEIAGSSSEEFSALIRQDSKKWGDLIRSSGIKLDL